jgi:hypothetical protein
MSVYFGYGNILETAIITITSEATGYPGYRLYDKDVSLPWKATSAVSQTIRTDAGAGNTNTINRMILTGHNLSCVTNLKLDWSDNGSSWTNIVTLNPSNNDTINSSFSASTHRYFRVVIDAPSSVPEISELYLGDSIEIKNPIYSPDTSPQYIRTREETQSGVPWIIENGSSKDSFIGDFNHLTEAQKNYIFAACEETSFFFIDHDGVLRYVEVKGLRITKSITPGTYFDIYINLLEVEVI